MTESHNKARALLGRWIDELNAVQDLRDQIRLIGQYNAALAVAASGDLKVLIAKAITTYGVLQRDFPDLARQPELVSKYEMVTAYYQIVAGTAATVHRHQLISQRREVRNGNGETQARLCASCGKRPARIDDLCKRCAHDAGTLPHGKIT